MQKEFEEMFFLFEIIACEEGAIICLYQKESTCSRQSVGKAAALRFWISLRETFYNRIAFIVMNKHGKEAFV